LLNNTFEQKVIFDLRRDLYSHIHFAQARVKRSRLSARRARSHAFL